MPLSRPLPGRQPGRAALRCGALAGLLLAAACARLPQQLTPAPMRQPASFQAASLAGSGGWPGADWVRQFRDPQLVALTAEALANNPDLQGARARIAAAEAQAEAAHGAALPSATALFSANRGYVDQDVKLQTPAGPTQPSSSWSNTGQALVGLTWELDLWGKNRANLAAAISQQKAAEAEEQQARLSLSTALATAYNQLAQQCAARAVSAQLLEQRRGLERLAAKRYAAGLDSEVERSRAGQDADDSATQLTQLDEQILLTRHQLGELLGAGPDRGLGVKTPQLASLPTPPLPQNLPLQLLGRRPDIVAARWQVEAAARQVDMAKARFYPDINLSAFAGYASFGLGALSNSYVKGFGAGPALTLPIFEGGQLRANLKGQAAQYDSAVASYNQTLNTALTEVANQITSIRSADAQLATQGRSLEASRRTYALMQQRHDAGLVSDGTVLDAQAAMLAAQQRSLDLEARRRALQIALVKALGGGFEAQARNLALR
jgi:NodT family efflux transporter outer membrane factor (OMF) lipoprotein